jgi:hypothetical protein
MKLTHCTFTGVDEASDLSIIDHLSLAFPIVEWGFLYSPKRQGQPGRYPARTWIETAFKTLAPHVPVALHLCGDGVRFLLEGQDDELGLLHLVHKRGGRIQHA